MSRVIIFGSHGKVGQRLVKLLSQNDKIHSTAVVRNASQAEQIKKLSNSSPTVETRNLDLADATVSELSDLIKDHNAVVLSVGSGGKNLLQVDLDGVVKTFEAARDAKVRRLILVSAAYANDRSFVAQSPLRNYYTAKMYADRILESEFKDSLDYTILRPSRLDDGPGTGKIQILRGEADVGSVDREDVASVIAEILHKKSTFGRAYDFKSGDSPISNDKTWE